MPISNAVFGNDLVKRAQMLKEAWRYSPLTQLQKTQFKNIRGGLVESKNELANVSSNYLTVAKSFLAQNADLNKQIQQADAVLFFVNGQYVDEVSSEKVFLSVAPAFRTPHLHYSDLITGEDLQTKYAVQISAGSDGPQKLVVLNYYTDILGDRDLDTNSSFTTRNIYNVGSNADVEIIECHLGSLRSPARIYNQSDVRVEANSKVSVVQSSVFKPSSQVYFLNDTHFELLASASADVFNYASGGVLSRHEYDVQLLGEGAQAKLYSFAHAKQKAHIVMGSNIEHRLGNTKSEQLAKSIVVDKSQFVFSGRLLISPNAQKSDASQYNHNLVLSDEAEVYTRPQLLVDADDVKAAHGATVGSLNEGEIFYLQSRGVQRDQAEQMLMQGFMQDFFNQIACSNFSQKTAVTLAQVNFVGGV